MTLCLVGPDPKMCQVTEKRRLQTKPSELLLAQVKNCFFLFAAGIAVSIFAFISPLVCGKFRACVGRIRSDPADILPNAN